MAGRLINFKVVLNVIGGLVFIVGGLMVFSIPFSLYFGEGDFLSLLFSSVVSIASGLFLRYTTRKHRNDNIKKREGYLIVALGWFSMGVFGTLPYLISGTIPGFTNAFFETISGITTTGATILNDIESLPKGILFWRSMTQWIGGMGIIVLTIAVLPLLGVGGMELFASEAPGPTKDKIHPRIKETAKRLWYIYVVLTALEIVLLSASGMSFYDAVNHSLTTMSTGGFSTKQASIGHYNSPLIEYIVIVFMFLAGTNFILLYFGFKLHFKKIIENDEFKWYLLAVLVLILIIFPGVYYITHHPFEKSFRLVLFQVVSLLTTTGYATADYTNWGLYVTFIFFLLLFMGASAGSTSGGIKLVRIVLLVKNSLVEFKRKMHPNAVVFVQINNKTVPEGIIYNLMAFLFFFLLVFVLGSITMTILGVDLLTAISSVATSIGNVGPGIAGVGPSETFEHLPAAGKWVLALLMLLGRLELFTIAILFTPYFWRRI